MDNEKTPEAVNPALKLARRLRENKSSLHIARLPDKTRKLFIKIADEEFCSDYGMLLKFLLDKVISRDTKHILEKLEDQEKRILKLESEEKNDIIKTLNGKQFEKEVKKT